MNGKPLPSFPRPEQRYAGKERLRLVNGQSPCPRPCPVAHAAALAYFYARFGPGAFLWVFCLF